ncbi:MAG: prepilin-type N-terminal cleavage/methylation domain-containing protein [Candidatus Pacebacteria bacterium]|nr:prepilin-type N-terminal cleavage/methylation domain-containing protein [Candidatus Paceibacterota bacterium]
MNNPVPHADKSRGRRASMASRFTLVELLVVMVVLGILMAIAGPAFDKMTVGTGVDAGVRAVTGQLRMARQYAIANRKYVAVVLPDDTTFSNDTAAVAIHACQSDTETGTYTPVPDTSWEFLPTGAVVFEITQSDRAEGASLPASPTDNCSMQVKVDVDDDGTDDDLDARAIVFRPTGALAASSTHVITIAQGYYDSGIQLTQKTGEAKNWREIHINPFTGRVKVE